MNRSVKGSLVVMALLAAMPALAQGTMRQRWAGVWFGTGQPEDRSEMYIDTFNADGSFRNQHRWCRQGKALDRGETGRWRIEGNILIVDIATVDNAREPRTDRYRIIAADGKTQHYAVLPSNFEYRARKVDGKFPMPPCDLSS